MALLVFFIIVVIIGALLGGKSFGGTIRKGCGFFVMLVIIAIAMSVYSSRIDLENGPENQEVSSTVDKSARFVVKENCQTYTQPNIKSDSSGNLENGRDLFVEDINKFDYFYEITNGNGKKEFVRKECLKIK